MKTPKITVFYDDEEQEFVHLSCYRSDIFNMDLTYNKQMGNDHVLKVKVETGKKCWPFLNLAKNNTFNRL
uniref:Uncharacterized protein n=1 Tax=Spilarctia obliqua nucleopolyhedrovirus TaxID=1638618 RepID=A0A7G9U8J7_9ABAC|nr:hypothetical protein [Spilarctia obliqua nucleopolyhedrovirus]